MIRVLSVHGLALWCCLLLCMPCLESSAAPAQPTTQNKSVTVKSVRLWRAPDNTRVVFDLSGPVTHSLQQLGKPDRVVLDIQQAATVQGLGALAIKDTPIAAIRQTKLNASTLRVVFDLRAKVTPRSFFLLKHGGKDDRLVLDLEDQLPVGSTETASVDAIEETASVAQAAKKPPSATSARPTASVAGSRRPIIIAIDAGHGGEDPGAIGPGRIQEKAVVLNISKQLEQIINATPGYKAVMVRSGDYYIPLVKRRDKARQLRADLFVSIHADAFHKPQAHGASVFALSSRGATSETARFLAMRENEADLIGGVGNVNLTDMEKTVAEVIVDFAMTATLSTSLDVGAHILRELGRVTPLHKRHVEQAGFVVLKSPDVPSVLVETGFISNPREAQKLNTPAHRKVLATAIFTGIRNYFRQSPPPDTLIAQTPAAARVGPIDYIVQRGDTLSNIAQRHNVSLQQLISHNRLRRHSVIQAGQKLSIPAPTGKSR